MSKKPSKIKTSSKHKQDSKLFYSALITIVAVFALLLFQNNTAQDYSSKNAVDTLLGRGEFIGAASDLPYFTPSTTVIVGNRMCRDSDRGKTPTTVGYGREYTRQSSTSDWQPVWYNRYDTCVVRGTGTVLLEYYCDSVDARLKTEDITCPQGSACYQGKCQPISTICTNECSTEGAISCANSNTQKQCIRNADSDPCLEWGNVLQCPTDTGFSCVEGQGCVPQPTTNQPPQVTFVEPSSSVLNQPVTLTATVTDPNANPIQVRWSCNGGTTWSNWGANNLFTYTCPAFTTSGAKLIRVEPRDSLGAVGNQYTHYVTINPPTTTNQPPRVTSISPTGVYIGRPVTFTATATDPNGNLPLQYRWKKSKMENGQPTYTDWTGWMSSPTFGGYTYGESDRTAPSAKIRVQAKDSLGALSPEFEIVLQTMWCGDKTCQTQYETAQSCAKDCVQSPPTCPDIRIAPPNCPNGILVDQPPGPDGCPRPPICQPTQCSDQQDNDQDAYIDYPSDFGCINTQDNDERNNNGYPCLPAGTCFYQCSDSLDNDGDLKVDQLDPQCSSRTDTSEAA